MSVILIKPPNTSVFFVIFFLLNSYSFAKEPIVNVLAEVLFPISYQDNANKEIKGFATDIIRSVLDEANLEYTLKIYPWTRAYTSVINIPNTLIYSVARIPEREEQIIWLQKIITLNYSLYTPNKSLIDKSLDDVKNMYITVTENGVSHSTLVKLGFHNFIFIDDFNRISQLVDRNRIEIIFTSSFWYKHNKHSFSKQLYKLKNIDLSTSDISLYFGLNKNSDPTVVSKLSKAFKVIKDNGKFDKIVNSYQYNQFAKDQ